MKILIADDEQSIRSLLLAILQGLDHQIFVAQDGEEALDIVVKESPDLLLLDVDMPKVTGLEVCTAVKSDLIKAKTRIILLTAKTTEADIKSGMEAGADLYMTKPFSPTALLLEVQRSKDIVTGH